MNKRNSIIITMLLLGGLLFGIIPMSYSVSLPMVYYANNFIFWMVMALLLWLNSYVLIPQLLLTKKIFSYAVALLVGCGLILLFTRFTESWLQVPQKVFSQIHPDKPYSESSKYFVYIFFVQLFTLGINTTLIILRRWHVEEKMRIETEEKRTSMELSMLRSQINPHFFFNALNTINALTYTDVELSRFAISKLSNIMRHVLYEDQEQDTTLGEETAFIADYIELMKLRLPSKVKLIYRENIADSSVKVAPMLLMPFIENCFKHGISNRKEDNEIRIELSYQPPFLTLETLNPLDQRSPDSLHSKGIGIENTIRRLDLLYADQYELKTSEDNHRYHLYLKIKLSRNEA